MEGIDTSLLKALRKSYQAIEKLQEQWQKNQDSSFVFVESLLNLNEQLQCCDVGAFELELRNDFPDLKKRLAYKIMKAMEDRMRRLYELLYVKIDALRWSVCCKCNFLVQAYLGFEFKEHTYITDNSVIACFKQIYV